MLLIPAIDLKDKKCVRLRQGKMDQATIFSDSPVEMAHRWVEAGCKRLHLVDLDAAFAGEPVNDSIILEIVKSFPDVPIQIGGGIRNLDIAKRYIDLGVQFIIIGTQAVKSPSFVDSLCKAFTGQVIVGIDAKSGMVATDGWAKTSNVSAKSLAKQFENMGVSSIVYTDIARDGMMQGVNIDETSELAKHVDIPIIASGGVSSMKDIEGLLQVDTPIFGAIIGRAIYDGKIDLKEACMFVDESLNR